MIKELIDAIKNSKCTDRVLVWSACAKTDIIIEEFQKSGIEVCGYIDKRADEIKTFNSLKVYSNDVIKKDKYFVYIGLENFYPDIIEFMEECGYKEFENYWYPNHLFKIDSCKDYSDVYGNFYRRGGTEQHFNLVIGGGSRFNLGNENQIDESVCIEVRCGSVLEIGNNNTFGKDCYMLICAHMASLKIGNNNSFGKDCQMCCYHESFLKIGNNCWFSFGGAIKDNVCIEDNVTIQEKFTLSTDKLSKILIEPDCMISNNVNMRAGNSHNLYDLETNENINVCNIKDIVLHEHIWVGVHAFLLSGTDIGKGSIIGANTFVNKKFPNNVAIAGNPARIVRNKVAWRREIAPLFDSYEDFKEFDFTK